MCTPSIFRKVVSFYYSVIFGGGLTIVASYELKIAMKMN